jgi:drug/metabolite transporter (DMT)-like permease
MPQLSNTTTSTAPPLTLVLSALFTVYILWGSNFVAFKICLETMPPFVMLAMRWTVAGAVLYLWAIRRGDTVADRPRAREWRSAVVMGAVLFLCGNGGLVFGQQYLSAGFAALLTSTGPIWAILFAYLFFGEKLGPLTVAGLLLGLLGLALLIHPHGRQHASWIGVASVTFSAVMWSGGSVFVRTAPAPKRPLVAAGMQMLCGGGWLLIAAIVTGELGSFHLAHVSVKSWTSLAYTVFLVSIVAFPVYTWLLNNVPISVSSTFAYVNPVMGVFLGWLLLGEQVDVKMAAGASVIIAGVVLIVTSRGKTGRPRGQAEEMASAAAEAAPPRRMPGDSDGS